MLSLIGFLACLCRHWGAIKCSIGGRQAGQPRPCITPLVQCSRASRLQIQNAPPFEPFIISLGHANFDNMSTSDQEDEVPSNHRADQPIGSLQHRAQTWDTGGPARTLRGITEKKIRQKKNSYKYKEIAYHDDIRILKILHGKKGSVLECMLFPSSLRSKKSTSKSNCHEYWALSYWWGEDEPTHPVTMYDDTGVRDGLQTMTPFNSSGTFYIRNNLAAALQQFRKENEDVNVWVDAL